MLEKLKKFSCRRNLLILVIAQFLLSSCAFSIQLYNLREFSLGFFSLLGILTTFFPLIFLFCAALLYQRPYWRPFFAVSIGCSILSLLFTLISNGNNFLFYLKNFISFSDRQDEHSLSLVDYFYDRMITSAMSFFLNVFAVLVLVILLITTLRKKKPVSTVGLVLVLFLFLERISLFSSDFFGLIGTINPGLVSFSFLSLVALLFQYLRDFLHCLTLFFFLLPFYQEKGQDEEIQQEPHPTYQKEESSVFYCKYCGQPLSEGALYCTKCGKAQDPVAEKEVPKQFCRHCGKEVEVGQAICLNCGFPLQQDPIVIGKSTRSRAVAGILAILIGSLGIHNFYLGKNNRGLAQLLITVLTCGAGAFVAGIWSLIEGICILTEQEGYTTDAEGKKLS